MSLQSDGQRNSDGSPDRPVSWVAWIGRAIAIALAAPFAAFLIAAILDPALHFVWTFGRGTTPSSTMMTEEKWAAISMLPISFGYVFGFATKRGLSATIGLISSILPEVLIGVISYWALQQPSIHGEGDAGAKLGELFLSIACLLAGCVKSVGVNS